MMERSYEQGRQSALDVLDDHFRMRCPDTIHGRCQHSPTEIGNEMLDAVGYRDLLAALIEARQERDVLGHVSDSMTVLLAKAGVVTVPELIAERDRALSRAAEAEAERDAVQERWDYAAAVWSDRAKVMAAERDAALSRATEAEAERDTASGNVERGDAVFRDTERQLAAALAREHTLREALRVAEWSEVFPEHRTGEFLCPACGSERGRGHSDGCEIADALAALPAVPPQPKDAIE